MNKPPSTASDPDRPMLEVKDLRTSFDLGGQREIVAVDGVSFSIRPKETLAIVGESGSGKSVTSLSIMHLLPRKVGRIIGGSIRFEGREIADISENEARSIRGRSISMIFQEPMTSLNPVHTVGEQIAEVIREHAGANRAEALAQAVGMLELVGIPEPGRRAKAYPHEMSGGMRQRAMIAMALACKPKLLIADEPTTALDVTIQAQILDLMRRLQSQLGMAIMFITHDLGVVAEMADRMLVMYAGQVVESGTVREIFKRPLMPYTAGLMRSVPRLELEAGKTRLYAIPGQVPVLTKLPSGCRFRTRCAYARPACAETEPKLTVLDDGRAVRCHFWQELDPMSGSAVQ